MPIRRAAGTPLQETAPTAAPDGEPDASSEEAASVGEAAEAAASAPGAKEGEAEREAAGEGGVPKENGEKAEEGEKEEECSGEKLEDMETEAEDPDKKEDKDGVKEKPKKPVKRMVPAWATLSASKKVVFTAKFASNQPKVDDILIEAVESCKEKTGASAHSVMKFIVKKYPTLELDKRKYLLKKALQRQVERGTIRQLKGKGFSGSFRIGKQPPKPASKKPTVAPGMKAETLGDALPLIITRLCEPKEASYILIKKYVEQHYPQLNVENRPDILKSALVRAVERGYLEQITGKGASGTFQLKGAGDKVLLKGGPLEDAILTAITAMNEPKTCSITTLRKHLVETNKDSVEYRLVNTLKKTLQKCKVLGWMEQITGNGLTGTYQLSYPYYPSPAILFPNKQKEKTAEKAKRRRTVDSSEEESSEEEESESEEEESEDEAPPPKRKAQKRPPPKARRPPPSKKSRPAVQVKAKARSAPGRKAAPAAKKLPPPARKSAPPPTRKPAPPAKKPAAASRSAPSKKAPPPPAKATPVKKAAPAKKPKTPIVKKLTSRAAKRPAAKKMAPTKPAAKSAVKAKPAARKSARGRK